jgi:hypothetical protein
LSDAANITYSARQFAAAHEYFEEIARIRGVDRPIGIGVFETPRLAWLRRNAGDDEGAAQAASRNEYAGVFAAVMEGKVGTGGFWNGRIPEAQTTRYPAYSH